MAIIVPVLESNGINASHENGVRHFFDTVTFLNTKRGQTEWPGLFACEFL
jgi:hypothetical protein